MKYHMTSLKGHPLINILQVTYLTSNIYTELAISNQEVDMDLEDTW